MSLKKLTLYQAKLLLQRTKNAKLLGFDLGVNSTGISISSQDLTQAYPLKLVKSVDSRTDPIFAKQIVSIIRKQRPTAIVIGTVHQKFVQAHERQQIIVNRISNKLDIPTNYTLIDEACSTIQSTGLLKEVAGEMGIKGIDFNQNKNLKDLFAAIIILKRFLQYCKN